MAANKNFLIVGGGVAVGALIYLSMTKKPEIVQTGFVNPVTGTKLSTTGIKSFMYARSGGHMHRGIDIPANVGTPVYAAAGGIVRVASASYKPGFSGYGRVVVIEHADEKWTLYAHLNSVWVTTGQTVRAGQQVGSVGTTQFFKDDQTRQGKMGAHLHFEVSPRKYPQQKEASRVNPIAWLKSGGATVA